MRHEKITTNVREERERANRAAEIDKLRADIDYVGMMVGIEPEEEESEAMNHEQEI